MGGNALKHYNVTTLNKSDYFNTWNSIKNKLSPLPIKFNLIPAYKNKTSFGDMDILYYPTRNVDIIPLLLTTLNPHGFVRNGPCLSVTYPVNNDLFQIDLIQSNPTDYNFSLFYYSFNDLGNLLGRIYHKMGLKFSHNGLKYVLRDNNRSIIKEILITQDIPYILNLGQFPTILPEFNTLRDIFTFVSSTPLFNSQIFQLENRNHISRTRDKKRLTYNKFLTWIASQNNLPQYPWDITDKINILDKLFTDFPNFKNEVYTALENNTIKQKIHDKFNGNIIHEYTQLTGKSLGHFINYLKPLITNEFILNNDTNTIKNEILKYYQSYNPV